MKSSLNTTTEFGKQLLIKCPTEVLELYRTNLPIWSSLSEEIIKDILIKGKYPNKKNSLEDIKFYPFWRMIFILSFSQFIGKHIPNMYEQASELNPEAFAIDFHYRASNGEDFNRIFLYHQRAVKALYLYSNILFYYLAALFTQDHHKTSYYIARYILRKDDNYIKKLLDGGIDWTLKNINSSTVEKTKSFRHILRSYYEDEIQSGLNIALAETIDTRKCDNTKLSNIADIKQILEDDPDGEILNKIMDAFSSEVSALTNALNGKFSYIYKRAAGRTIDFTIRQKLQHYDLEANLIREGENTNLSKIDEYSIDRGSLYRIITAINNDFLENINRKENKQKKKQLIDKLKNILELSKSESAIFDLIAYNPNLKNADIVEKTGLHRNTISRNRFSLIEKLSTFQQNQLIK